MIFLIGDTPSKKNYDPDIAFVGTTSYKRLLEWIYKLDIDISDVVMVNKDKVHKYSPNRYAYEHYVDHPECSVDIIPEKDKIIALGKNASKYLTKLKLEHHAMDHPSGLNQKLNDKKYVKEMLQHCREYLEK